MTCEKIWDKFEIKNMDDYHDHYFKKYVLLLADVFEKFIATCLKFYGLDPCHYFSSPGLSWDAMLRMTDVKLEKISDIDKYLFIEKGLRRGISYIAKWCTLMIIMILKNSQHLYHTLTWIIYMVGQWVSIFFMRDLNG